MTPRVYLAGPDVFEPEHARIFVQRRALCRSRGLEPLTPVDNEARTAPEIFAANVRLLETCDGVIANVTPFRGPHCDVGTAWEIGYAVARGTPVFCFSGRSDRLVDRVAEGRATDAQGMSVEDFGLGENLMIVMSVVGHTIHHSFEAAVEAAVGHFAHRPAQAG